MTREPTAYDKAGAVFMVVGFVLLVAALIWLLGAPGAMLAVAALLITLGLMAFA